MQALIVFSACLAVAAAGHIGYYGGVGIGYAGKLVVGLGPGPSPVLFQYHAQDELSQHSYGYISSSNLKSESRPADGVTRGGYSYVDANGLLHQVQYVSDRVNGFRAATTVLPVAPVAAGVAPVDYAALPAPASAPVQGQGQDTAEAEVVDAQTQVEAAAGAGAPRT